ncbi:Asp-tRNA(Asn)/Glu-tRNA(Gln) amidotransferase subunit GatC [Candidatus Peregrinibacteria bacterium]|jgi:aspartyl-tRNA(Asn)/glutamyl-tRNA(Gln) amidotransferase subunit C|nr:Asp-tRNA(Asn)/Glu-tRNA(Gln) amidotransferase subunit GatC [Candidatus Peregrinibacteria bacterium]MBT4056098.1 Asp-tRNA(Asn)/Glu-tRNA(Gln) amidotransferase subunit GatC [Candidatus Peregrinibacteria bacterium]
MAKISEKQVGHVAKLARLGLTRDEVKKFSGQLSAVFEYIEVLEEVDTSDVVETSQVTGLENVKEKDEVVKWEVSGKELSGEDLLESSGLPVESKQILVKAAVKKS